MDAAAELGRNPVSKHQIQPEYGDEQADAGRNCRTRLARPDSQARTGTGHYSISLFSLAICDDYTYCHHPTYTTHTLKILPLQRPHHNNRHYFPSYLARQPGDVCRACFTQVRLACVVPVPHAVTEVRLSTFVLWHIAHCILPFFVCLRVRYRIARL